MDTKNHYQGRLRVGADHPLLGAVAACKIYTDEEPFGDVFAVTITNPPSPTAAEDARRLAACWNVCIGVSTEELESSPGMLLTPEEREHLAAEMEQRSATRQNLRELIRAWIETNCVRASWSPESATHEISDDQYDELARALVGQASPAAMTLAHLDPENDRVVTATQMDHMLHHQGAAGRRAATTYTVALVAATQPQQANAPANDDALCAARYRDLRDAAIKYATTGKRGAFLESLESSGANPKTNAELDAAFDAARAAAAKDTA